MSNAVEQPYPTSLLSSSRANRRLAVAILAATLIAVVVLHMLAFGTKDLPFQIRNKDFANYWMAGILTLGGHVLTLFEDPAIYFASMKDLFGADYPWHNWSYPPHAILFLLPLGALDYLPAMVLFLGLTLALYVKSLATMKVVWNPLAILLMVPFIIANLVSTQNGFATAALVIAGLSLRDRNPLISGLLFGILTVKPQLGILLPILLLVERRWSVIASAAATAIALAFISLVAFGAQPWKDYFAIIAPYQTEVMNTLGGDFPHMMGSAFGSARSLGLGAHTAMMVHLPVAAASALLYGWLLFKQRDLAVRGLATLLATFLIVPYSVAYDYGSLAAFAAAAVAGLVITTGALRITMILIAVLPVAMLPLGQAGLPITPLLLLAALTQLALMRPEPESELQQA